MQCYRITSSFPTLAMACWSFLHVGGVGGGAGGAGGAGGGADGGVEPSYMVCKKTIIILKKHYLVFSTTKDNSFFFIVAHSLNCLLI